MRLFQIHMLHSALGILVTRGICVSAPAPVAFMIGMTLGQIEGWCSLTGVEMEEVNNGQALALPQ